METGKFYNRQGYGAGRCLVHVEEDDWKKQKYSNFSFG
jgi:hypothetical protein